MYKKFVKNNKTFYFSNATDVTSNSALVFGDFMERGEVWHIKVLVDNPYQPIYAFEEDRGPDECPQVLGGLGGTIHCYHEKFDEFSLTGL